MTDITNLQDAVETARTAYARASEQHARSRKHALSMIHIVEEQLRDKRIELSQNEIQREGMAHEYGQLRQMLHTLVMTVEAGATETSKNGSVKPNVVTPLAPMAETAQDSKPQRKRTTAGAAKNGVGAEELRAGLKRMLKKKQLPAAELETIAAEGTEAPAPAE